MTNKSELRSEQHWLIAVSKDSANWYASAFYSFPSVISHEYHRIWELCQAKESYGVLLQIKDLLESLLKYQVLSVCAYAKEKQLKDFETDIAVHLTSESLSLGAWMELGRLIVKYFKNAEVSLPDPMKNALETTTKFYNKNNYVFWRNETIGHGALGFTEDVKFQDDITAKLKELVSLFSQIEKNLSTQKLYIGDTELTGYTKARDLEVQEGTIFIHCEETTFCADPYIVLRDGCVFFFDNQKRKVISQMQCYPNGHRRNEHCEYFQGLRRLLDEKGIDKNTGIDSEYMTRMEEQYIQRLSLAAHFVEPEYITAWLRQCLSEKDKGVFLLEMCRGTGKSTYTEMLNTLNKNPLRLEDDLEVRTFHVQRSQNYTCDDFEQHIENQWAQCFDGNGWAKPPRMMTFRLEEKQSPEHALSMFLEKALGFYQRRYDKEKILLVLDGLDEITNDEIWQYIPSSDLLADGVYILLTARSSQQEDLPPSFQEKISRLTIDGRLLITPESENNILFLRKYLEKNEIKNLKGNDIQRLLQLADHRVLYLGLLCKLLHDGMNIDTLPDSSCLVQRYLEILSQSYGEKHAAYLREVLVFLSTWGICEPVSLREIAMVLGDGDVTLELLGIINDLMPFLKVNRGYEVNGQWYAGKNRYTVANDELAYALRNGIKESGDIVSRIVKGAMAENEDDEKEIIYDSEEAVERSYCLLVLGHARECLKMLGMKGEEIKCEVLINHFFISAKAWTKFIHVLALQRGYGMVSFLISVSRPIDEIEELAELNVMGRLYVGSSLFLKRMLKWDERDEMVEKAVACFRKIIAIIKQSDQKSVLHDRLTLARSYYNLAFAYQINENHTEAIMAYKKAIKIVERFDQEDLLADRDSLATGYQNMALAFGRIGEKDEAFEFYKKAIAIEEQLEQEGLLIDRNDLAITYTNLALSFDEIKNYDEAIKFYKKAIAIREQLNQEGLLADRNDLASSYHNLAFTLEEIEEYGEAIKFHKKAIAIKEQLDQNGLLADRNDLAASYHNLALMLEELEKYDEAFALYEKAIAVREQLDQKGLLTDRGDLATSYHNLAFMLEEIEEHGEAIKFYKKAIAVREQLDQKGLLTDRGDLATSYHNMAYTHKAIGKYDEAIALYKKAIRIKEKLEDRDTSKREKSLAKTYYRIADVYHSLKKTIESIFYYQESIDLYEKLLHAGEVPDVSKLIDVYSEAAVVLDEMGRHQEATEYRTKADALK